MRKGFLVAAMALVVILAAGVANAQQHVFWLAPGERVDYAGAVDDWTGSMAQRQLESTRSMIHGPIRDLNRHLNANNGNPDPYYGTGVSPASAPYGLGQSGYNDPYGNYGYNNNRGYRRSGSSYGNRNRGYRSHSNRRDGYSRPATQADVRGWGVGNALLTAGTFVAGEIRAGKRDKREDARHQETMAELRAQREYEPETPRSAEARGYYTTAATRPSRHEYKLINGLGMDVCVNDTLLNVDNGNRTTVSDPYHMKFSAPPGKTICPVEAEFISEDTILATCKGRR